MTMTIKLDKLAPLLQRAPAQIHKELRKEVFSLDVLIDADINVAQRSAEFSYLQVLAMETARQFSDDGGLPLRAASQIVANAMAPFPDDGSDLWIGVVSNRNTGSVGHRYIYPATSFGGDEYWSSAHVAGSFDEVGAKLKDLIATEAELYPDSDPARILLVNVSAADRRLARRINALTDLHLTVIDREFATA